MMDEHSLLELRDRIGDEHLGRRLRAQVDLTVRILGQGRARFHFENVPFFIEIVKLVLRVTGLHSQGRRNALALTVRENRAAIRDLPAPFDGLRVLHLSDLHLDGYPGFGQHIANAISGLDFDVCVLTGDFRFFGSGQYHTLAAELDALAPALACRFGVYGILGNHDFIEMVPMIEARGIRMLLNESVALTTGGPHPSLARTSAFPPKVGGDRGGAEAEASLWLVGLEDAHLYGLHDFDKGLRDVPPDAPRILLIHSPEVIPEAGSRGFGLYLTGHTHGGQFCLPGGWGPYANARCPRRYAAGAWQYNGMAGYTSWGTGSSGVFARFFCPPEIVIHTLRPTT